jgi:hypothetical protein
MSDTRRLVDDPNASDLARDLVRTWNEQKPSAEAVDRAMGLATVASGGVAAGALAAKLAAGAGGSIPPKAAAGASLLAKWLFISGAAVLVGSAGVAYVAMRPDAPPSTNGSATTAGPSSPAIASPAPAEAPPSADTSAKDVSALRSVPADATPKPRTSPPAARGSASTLDDQIAAMDQLRKAITAGDAPRALALVDDYERRYPHGAFVEEAEVHRIEALVRIGDRAAATRAADRFLAAHPSSPHAAHVRSLVGATPP